VERTTHHAPGQTITTMLMDQGIDPTTRTTGIRYALTLQEFLSLTVECAYAPLCSPSYSPFTTSTLRFVRIQPSQPPPRM
jgi:hypothetical protein